MAPVPDPKLRADVAALTRHVEALVQHMDKMVHDKVQTEVASQAVPREEFTARVRASGRRIAAAFALVVVLLGGGVLLNRITLNAARADLSEQIVTCFLRPGSASPRQTAACARRFGSEYAVLQQRSRDATADFVDLRKWAKERGWEPPSERKP
jgi:hypothetical protein